MYWYWAWNFRFVEFYDFVIKEGKSVKGHKTWKDLKVFKRIRILTIWMGATKEGADDEVAGTYREFSDVLCSNRVYSGIVGIGDNGYTTCQECSLMARQSSYVGGAHPHIYNLVRNDEYITTKGKQGQARVGDGKAPCPGYYKNKAFQSLMIMRRLKLQNNFL